MYLWMDHIIGPETNAKVAAYFGEAPGQSKSCDLIGDLPPSTSGRPEPVCKDYHADRHGVLVAGLLLEDADCGLR